MSSRIPAEVFPPGEFLRDEMEARDWTQLEFAERLGVAPEMLDALLEGTQAIDAQMAGKLSAALGTSAQYWSNLQSAYEGYMLPRLG